MRKLMMATLALLALTGAAQVSAQSATATGNVSITIDKVAYIDIGSADVGFNTPTNGDFAAGVIGASNSVDVQYGSNAPHALQVQLGSLGAKDVADLEWSADGGSSWTPMTTSASDVVSEIAGGLNTATLDFQMKLDWATDAAGTYEGTITYTVVAN